MRALTRLVFVLFLALAIGAALFAWYARATGLVAKARPAPMEARAARAVRSFAVPPDAKSRRNPVLVSQDVLNEGMAHYADHCASCHATDGSGNTEMGRGLYPNAPDMRLQDTQALSDGELFYIIENGVRFTGMPGWSTGTEAGETSTWHLVHFIRHLPALTPAEIERMDALTPRSPDEVRQQIEEEQFLKGATQ